MTAVAGLLTGKKKARAEAERRKAADEQATEQAKVDEQKALDEDVATRAKSAKLADSRRVKGRASTLLTAGGAAGILGDEGEDDELKLARASLLGA